MKVLVTGGAGFIGSHTSEFLLKRGDTVVAIDEVNDYYDVNIKQENLDILTEYEKFSFYKKDICDRAFLAELFEKEKFDVVCHLAARAGVRPSLEDPFVYVHSNVEGTIALLEAARLHNIKNFVYASSSSVYGSNLSAPFKETDQVDHPMSPYAATKRACEVIAWTYHSLYKIPLTGLRFFTVYGPRGRPDMAPFMFVDSIYKGKTIRQFGDGSSRRDYTYIDDIVSGVVGAIDHPQPYEILNLGRGETIMLSEFIALIEDLVGKKADIKIEPEQPGDVPLTFADVSKARKLVGYSPSFSTRDGMRETVKWYLTKYTQKNAQKNE